VEKGGGFVVSFANEGGTVPRCLAGVLSFEADFTSKWVELINVGGD
jgi:hypothetical protein